MRIIYVVTRSMRVFGAVCLALATASEVRALSSGITSDQFSNPSLGCMNTGCHSGGTAPTVSLTGPTMVAPGSINEYTLQITQPSPGQTQGGLNVSAPSGTFTVGGSDAANTQTDNNPVTSRDEITHTAPKTAVGGFTTFTFLWTAPLSFTSVTLTGWGNAVDGTGTSLNDAAGSSTLQVFSTMPSLSCSSMPLSGCKAPLKTSLQLKVNAADHSKDQLKWKWLKGEQTVIGELGTPSSTTTYVLCLYENTSTLLASYIVPPNSTFWSPIGNTGFKYKDSNGTESGVNQVQLKSGDAGKAKVQVKGRGVNLPDLALSASVPARFRSPCSS